MKKLLLLFVLLITVNQLIAQIDMAMELSNLSIEVKKRGFEKDAFIEGTPYATEANSTGIFYQKNKTVVKTPTRLNYFLNCFEFELKEKTFSVIANTIDSVILDGATYFYRTFNVNGKNLQRAVKVIDRLGSNKIYVYQGVEFNPEVKARGYVEPKPACYEWEEPIYIFEIGDKLITLNNFKEVTKTFPDKEKEIKKFIKDNKISKDNPNELKLLLGYLSKL